MTNYKRFLQTLPTATLWVFLCLFSLFVLSACGQFEKVNEEVAKTERSADKALRTIAPSNQPKTPLKVDNRPWYGAQAVPITNGIPLPASVNQQDAVVMTFAQPVDLFTAAQMIQSVTGIRTLVANGTITESLGENVSNRVFTPTGGEEVSGGRIVWSGRLETLLNQIADTFAAEWNYDGSMIRFSQETTRTFMLHSLANEVNLSGAVSTGQSDDTNIPEIDVDGTATLQIWAEISEAVERMIGEQGSASFSPSTGTITVTARPEVTRRVENYLRYQNAMRLRRVAISVKVLSVSTADSYTYGVDINGVIRQALGRSLSLEGSSTGANGLDLSILKNPTGAEGDFAATLAASEEIDRVSIVHSGSLVTLSDQPAPLQVGRQISYLERVSSTAGDAGGSVSLEPGTVDVGLFMTVLPRIVEGDRILMRLSVAITDTTQPFQTFGADGIEIQLPEIETTGFLQNAVLNDGETMVIAGFEKSQNSYGDDGTPGGLWTGGVRSTNRGRDLAVLLINAQILPEEPLTVIGE